VAEESTEEQRRTELEEAAKAVSDGAGKQVELPDEDVLRALLEQMALIRRFEEEAGRQYQRAKAGGFLHLAIGEEATIVGTVSAMRDEDHLIAPYRSHGHVLARGSDPKRVMAELFGRVDGLCGGRGGSMHMFDVERRFMGGYGIVGGNLPLGAGLALASDYKGEDTVTVCFFGDGASNQGTFGETMNLCALWKLPIVFLVENNLYGMGTSLERHSAVTDLSRKAEGYGIPGVRIDGMDVLAVREAVSEHIRIAREEHRPTLLEAFTYRFRGHSAADPEVYRTKDEVEEWRKKDPVTVFRDQLVEQGVISEEDLEELRERIEKRVTEAVEFADNSPEPPLESLYDNLYVVGDQVPGWYGVDERTPEVHPPEREHEVGREGRVRELAEAGAAYGGQQRGPRESGDSAPKPSEDQSADAASDERSEEDAEATDALEDRDEDVAEAG
jgi:pyruvate dehydrogenase E1 component alpha subunit